MGYIIKKSESLVNVKLTDKGRENLSLGQLQFTNCSLSDGEMVYTDENSSLLNILRPADNQPAATYMIPSESTNYIVPITSIVSFPQIVYSAAKDRGFFTGTTYNEYIFNYMLCGGYRVPKENFQGGNILTVVYNTGDTVTGTTINPTGATPNIGDLMLIKVPTTGYTGTVFADYVDVVPLPYLWYQIIGITGATNTGLTVAVDRTLPDMGLTGTTTGNTAYAYFYVGGDMISKVFDEAYPYAYWSKGLLNFTDTCDNGSHDVPIWNMSIVYAEDLVGLDYTAYKGHNNVVSTNYMSIYPYLKYALNEYQTKVGIIHYTNNTVNNYYGEGFYSDTLQLHLPTLMYHKKQFGGAGYANQIGYTFVCDSTLKNLDNFTYYDLIDTEVTPTAIGKVFPDLQIVIIENEEVITAMSLKSNRNWSLPQPVLTDIDPGHCNGSGSLGIITSAEELHVTYALVDYTNGITGIQCENYATVGTARDYADVQFMFPHNPLDPTYSEFGYFKKHADGIGFSADAVWIILQKTAAGDLPDPTAWKYFEANSYIGTNGCIPVTIPTINSYQLYSESVIVTNVNQVSYPLTYQPIGSVIVSRKPNSYFGGLVLNEAVDLAHIYPDPTCAICGDYLQVGQSIYVGITTGHTTGGTLTNLQVGDLLQFHYLVGTTIAGTTQKIDDLVPNVIPTVPVSPTDIYRVGTEIYIDLPTTPAGQVYVFYNGNVLSQSNYTIEPGGSFTTYKVHFNFTPSPGARITILYLDNTGSGTNPAHLSDIKPAEIDSLQITLNDQTFPVLATNNYDINLLVTVPRVNTTGMTFGDETFFFGNIETDIKATIYKSIINLTVMPNRFITSNNPTFNANINKVAFTEIDIYDNNGEVVGVGKFSQPLQRTLNSDVLIINATIDF
jgi:hypothetical protein